MVFIMRRTAQRGLSRRRNVCPSVRHSLALCQNGETHRQAAKATL